MKNVTVLSIVACIMLILTLYTCKESTEQDSLSRIIEGKSLKVGFIPYYDITFRNNQTGEVEGLLVEILYEITDKHKIPRKNIKFIETDWHGFGLGLKSGKYDISIAGTFNTIQRQKVVRFTTPIFYLGNGAAVLKSDNRFINIEDFDQSNVKIAVIQGEQGYEYARNNFKKAELKILSGSDLSLAPLQVKKGLADAALSDQYILRRYVNKNPELKDALANKPYFILPVCWSVSKKSDDDELLQFLNRELKILEENGKLENIKSKYEHLIPFADEYIEK